MDEPGTAEFWERGGQVGVGGQAISLLSGSMPQVACKHAMRRPSERQRTTKEMAHLSSSGNCKLWQRIRAGKVDLSSTATMDSEGQNTTMTFSFFPSHRWFEHGNRQIPHPPDESWPPAKEAGRKNILPFAVRFTRMRPMVVSRPSFTQRLCTWKLYLEEMPHCLCAHQDESMVIAPTKTYQGTKQRWITNQTFTEEMQTHGWKSTQSHMNTIRGIFYFVLTQLHAANSKACKDRSCHAKCVSVSAELAFIKRRNKKQKVLMWTF